MAAKLIKKHEQMKSHKQPNEMLAHQQNCLCLIALLKIQKLMKMFPVNTVCGLAQGFYSFQGFKIILNFKSLVVSLLVKF